MDGGVDYGQSEAGRHRNYWKYDLPPKRELGRLSTSGGSATAGTAGWRSSPGGSVDRERAAAEARGITSGNRHAVEWFGPIAQYEAVDPASLSQDA